MWYLVSSVKMSPKGVRSTLNTCKFRLSDYNQRNLIKK